MIRLTTGPLPLPLKLTAQREGAESNTINVSWKQDLHFPGERLRDELKMIARSNGEFSEMISSGLTRRCCGESFELPVNYGTASHLYLFLYPTITGIIRIAVPMRFNLPPGPAVFNRGLAFLSPMQ